MDGRKKPGHDVQPRVAGWIKHAAQDRSPQAEAAVRWALSRLEEANVPEVLHAVVLTLTGNQKSAKQARKAAETAVRRAERKLNRTHHGHAKTWLTAGLLAAAAAAGVLIWRGLPGSGEPEAAQAGEWPTDASDTKSG
ncbi:glutathione S-transferase [Arthrobacter sp. UYNi723]